MVNAQTVELELEDPSPPVDECLTTTLPVSADEGFRRFCRMEETPEWLSIVRSVTIREVTPEGLPARVSYLAQLENACVGYELNYNYLVAERGVWWSTPSDSSMEIAGWARFTPLGEASSLMQYQLILHRGALPVWNDPFFNSHAPSAVVFQFRDYVKRSAQREQLRQL